MSINFISAKDSDETHNMYTKSNNIEIMIDSETGENIEEIFRSVSLRYQEKMRRINERKRVFFLVLIYCTAIFKKTSLKRIGSLYIDSPDWLKSKNTINP